MTHLRTESPRPLRRELSSPYMAGRGFGRAILTIQVSEFLLAALLEGLCSDQLTVSTDALTFHGIVEPQERDLDY